MYMAFSTTILYEQLGDIVDIRLKFAVAEDGLSDKDRINEFLGFCAGVICDGEVLEEEARAIVRRFSKDPVLNQHPHLVRLSDTLSDAIADGILTGAEAEDVKRWIVRIVGDGYVDTGLPSLGNSSTLPDQLQDHRAIIFPDRIFVVTGALCIAPRRKLAAMVADKGGGSAWIPLMGIKEATAYWDQMDANLKELIPQVKASNQQSPAAPGLPGHDLTDGRGGSPRGCSLIRGERTAFSRPFLPTARPAPAP